MADGRKIPYIIEMGINDEKLKRQMSQWDWEEIIGIKGFGKHFEKPAKEASDAIENAFANTSIDWEKALQTDAFKSAVTKIVQHANKELREGLLGKDEAKQVTEFISEIGKAWKEVGVTMGSDGFARSMAAFAKAVEPLVGQVDKLTAAFGTFRDKINSDTAKVAGGFTVIGDAAGRAAVKVNKSIETMEAKLASIDAMLSEDYGKKFKFDTDLEAQFYGIDEAIEKVETNIDQLSKKFNNMSSSDKGFEEARRNLVQLYTEQIELYRKLELVDEEYTKKHSKDDSLLTLNAIDPKAVIGDVRATIKTIVGDAKRQLQDISTSTKTTKDGINIPIKLPSQTELVKTINNYVKSINDSDAIHGVKLKIDSGWLNDAANVIEDKTTRAYGNTPADFDKNTSDLVKKTEDRFDKVANAINRKLSGENGSGGILGKTAEWRAKMLDLLKFDKEAFSFKFDTNLIQQLETLFEDYELPIRIDTEDLANQIKTVLEGSDVSLGGGTASIDPSAVASAVMAGVRAAFVGAPLTINDPASTAQDRIPDATEQVATEIEQTAKHLDIAEEYVQDIVEKIKAVAKYAVKPAGKDTDSTKATRKQFDLLGIDLTKVKAAGDDGEKIKAILETALLRDGQLGKLLGGSSIDELSNFKGSSSKTIPAFIESLREVFYMLQEDTETTDEWTRKKHSKEVFDWAKGRAKAADSLRNVRSPIVQEKIPSIESIDKAITLMAAIGRNTDGLEALRVAREKLGSQTDDASVKEFQSVASEFYKGSTKVFYDLKKQAEDMFKGTIYMQGRKKGVVKRQSIDSYKQLAKIDDNAVLLDIRVSSSVNNVALGDVKSKHSNRSSLREERRLMRGQRADYLVSPDYEKDILNRELEYGGFKPQGVSTTDVDIDKTLEANQKRKEALIAEIQLKEREKDSLENEISTLDEKIEQLTERNSKISDGRRTAAVEKVSHYESQQEQLTSEILFGDQNIQQITTNIEEQKQKRAIAEQRLTQLTELDVERAKKGIQNKIQDAEKERNALQTQLQERQRTYGALDTNRVFEQAEVFKARSALRAIPDTKANQSARAEAEKQVIEAEQRLDNATKALDNAGKEINEINEAIEKKTTLIETLNRQVSETTLDTLRKEQQNRIRAIDSVISDLELELANVFSQQSSRKNDLRVTKLKLRNARNAVAFKTPGELDDVIGARALLGSRLEQTTQSLQQNQNEISQLDSANVGLVEWQKRNELQERALVLQGAIKKLDEDGASKDVIASKRVELEEINRVLETSTREIIELKQQLDTLKAREIELQNMRYGGLPSAQFKQTEEESERISAQISEVEKKLRSVGGLIGQQEAREYSDAERKTYALQQLALIEDDLITARAQKNVVSSRIKKKDKEIAEVDTWGLGAGIGKSDLNKEKYKATADFMNSEYVHALQDALREQTKISIAAAEQYAREVFDEKVSNAMIKEGMNPFDQTQVGQFLETERGQQYSVDFANQVDTDTQALWAQYDARIKEVREKVLAEFKESMQVKDGVLSYASKTKDENGKWINELVEVYVRDALRERLVVAKEILEEQQTPIQDSIDRLEADKKAAITYGGIGEKEILSGDIIADQIRKEEKLAELLADRATKEQEIVDLEQAGVSDSDDSVKKANKELENIDKQIARYEMLIRNRKKLVELRYEESKEPDYTDEEKELHFTNQIVGYNEKIEASLSKQEELKQKIATASEEEKTQLQYNLKQEEDKVAGWRGKVSKFEGKLQNVGKAKSEASTTTSEVAGGILGLIKEAVGEVGASNVDLTKVEEILSKILAVLTGGQVVRDPEMEKKLARIAELEAKSKVVTGQKTSEKAVQKKEKKQKEALPDYIEQARKYEKETLSTITSQEELAKVAQNLVANIEKATQGSKKTVELQLKLQKVIGASGKLYKNSTGEKRYTKEKIGELLGIGDKVGLKLTEADARKIAEQGFTKTQRDAQESTAPSSKVSDDLFIISNATDAFSALYDAIVRCRSGFEQLSDVLPINSNITNTSVTNTPNVDNLVAEASDLLTKAKSLDKFEMPLANMINKPFKEFLSDLYQYFDKTNRGEMTSREATFVVDMAQQMMSRLNGGVQWGTYAQGTSVYTGKDGSHGHSHPTISPPSGADFDIFKKRKSSGLLFLPDKSFWEISGADNLTDENVTEIEKILHTEQRARFNKIFGDAFVETMEFPDVQKQLAQFGVDVQKYTFDKDGNTSLFVEQISDEVKQAYSVAKSLYGSSPNIQKDSEDGKTLATVLKTILTSEDYKRIKSNNSSNLSRRLAQKTYPDHHYMPWDTISSMQTISDQGLDLTRIYGDMETLVSGMPETEATNIMREFFDKVSRGVVEKNLINAPEMRNVVKHILGESLVTNPDDRVALRLQHYGYEIDPNDRSKLKDIGAPRAKVSTEESELNQTDMVEAVSKEKGADAKEREAKAEEKITKEKQKQKTTTGGLSKAEEDELARLKEEVKPKIVRSDDKSFGGLGSLAREDTLSKILEVLNAFKSDGVKTTGKKQGEKEEKAPKKTEAELIKERALRDKDEVLGIASSSKIKKKYEQLVKQLEAESDLSKIKALAQKTTALGFNIKKESAEWDYNTADANRVYNIPNANTFGKRPETVRKSMEKLAQGKFNPDGKQYEFLNFDGTKLSYQLTDIKGNVEKVTMSWSELNNQVAITSDKSVAKLDNLAGKVESFGDKFKNAVQMGYLAEDDGSYKEFLDKVAAIDAQTTFEDVEKARNEALQAADRVTKQINSNKKLYTGTTEMNAADRQFGKLEQSGILEQGDLKLVEEYENAYRRIAQIHDDLLKKKNGVGLLDETGQKQLRDASLEAQKLGKELEKAYGEHQQLQQAIDGSGMYNGQKIGGWFKVEDQSTVYDQMVAKLKELGAEHIKVDRVHKTATGTIRHNNRTVSDLTVKYDELAGALGRYQKQERESLTGLPAFLNGFKKKFNSIMQYLTMTMSIHQVMAQLRKGVQYVKEIDLALTELRKVTDETDETYERFLQTAAKTGERLGATISAITEATATFAKLGYSMSQATEMAEAAIVYKNVGDNIASTEDAADSIISTMKGFGLEATESMAIVDKFNEVGNRFAITSQGIGEALRLSASALNEGKNSLDESIALITAANEVVNDPSSVGTALKTKICLCA